MRKEAVMGWQDARDSWGITMGRRGRGGRGGPVKDCGEAATRLEKHGENRDAPQTVAQKDRSDGMDSPLKYAFQSGFKVSTKI